jgi:hypothetical protein
MNGTNGVRPSLVAPKAVTVPTSPHKSNNNERHRTGGCCVRFARARGWLSLGWQVYAIGEQLNDFGGYREWAGARQAQYEAAVKSEQIGKLGLHWLDPLIFKKLSDVRQQEVLTNHARQEAQAELYWTLSMLAIVFLIVMIARLIIVYRLGWLPRPAAGAGCQLRLRMFVVALAETCVIACPIKLMTFQRYDALSSFTRSVVIQAVTAAMGRGSDAANPLADTIIVHYFPVLVE